MPEINLEVWPELIFKFGPYAILALFVLWVAPRASKRMHKLTTTAPKAVRVSAAATVFGSWAVVLVMVGFVLFKWSPVMVYDGQLGILKPSEKIYPMDDNLYVKVDPAGAGEHVHREKWRFVLVERERALDDSEYADFTYFWGKKDEEYTDYSIPLSVIISGKVKDYRITQRVPEGAFIWKEGSWQVASYQNSNSQYTFNWRWNAHADNHLQAIGEQLVAPNRIARAKARKELRSLSEQELKQLLEMTNDQNTIRQIKSEQARRTR